MTSPDDRAQLQMQFNVSRETMERLDVYAELLRRWQTIKNLVAPSTMDRVWERHLLDSAQLYPLLSDRRVIADFGSGAGFPGLVLAIMLADAPGVMVHLVESNGRKAAFLREVARATGAPATIHPVRIEAFMQKPPTEVQLITARALAPLTTLLDYGATVFASGGGALFLKGQDASNELTEAAKYWKIEADLIPSVTDPAGRIIHVRSAHRPASSQASAE